MAESKPPPIKSSVLWNQALREGLLNEGDREYPIKLSDGRLVWACCLTFVGPVCEHNVEPSWGEKP